MLNRGRSGKTILKDCAIEWNEYLIEADLEIEWDFYPGQEKTWNDPPYDPHMEATITAIRNMKIYSSVTWKLIPWVDNLASWLLHLSSLTRRAEEAVHNDFQKYYDDYIELICEEEGLYED